MQRPLTNSSDHIRKALLCVWHLPSKPQRLVREQRHPVLGAHTLPPQCCAGTERQSRSACQHVRLSATPWAVQSTEFSRPDAGGGSHSRPQQAQRRPPEPGGRPGQPSLGAARLALHTPGAGPSRSPRHGLGVTAPHSGLNRGQAATRLSDASTERRRTDAAQEPARLLSPLLVLSLAVLLACRILIPQPGTEPSPPAAEAGVVTPGPPERSLIAS